MIRATTVYEVAVFEEHFITNAVESGVFLLVDVAVCCAALPHFLCGSFMCRRCSTNEVVVGKVERIA